MNQLKCTTINCKNNLKSHCNASVIGLNDKAQCMSKIKRAGGALEQTFAELEAADDFLAQAPSIVQCDAECVYNENHRCHATSILVKDTLLMKTRCETRIKPKD
ncbi:MAG: DUF1540 domain-containing protein [Clostridia bacterium]|nr:DUF1540 domain-containing protein [Clostridia bacterium]